MRRPRGPSRGPSLAVGSAIPDALGALRDPGLWRPGGIHYDKAREASRLSRGWPGERERGGAGPRVQERRPMPVDPNEVADSGGAGRRPRCRALAGECGCKCGGRRDPSSGAADLDRRPARLRHVLDRRRRLGRAGALPLVGDAAGPGDRGTARARRVAGLPLLRPDLPAVFVPGRRGPAVLAAQVRGRSPSPAPTPCGGPRVASCCCSCSGWSATGC